MMDDAELLRCYSESRAEEAFAELVRRRIGLVYAVALRRTRDAHRAEDVTQVVFTALARKADNLARRPVLVGWLWRWLVPPFLIARFEPTLRGKEPFAKSERSPVK